MAEELKVNIVGDASSLKGALGQAGGQVDGFAVKMGKIGKVATVAGGLITAAFAAIVTKTAAVGDKFDKMSLRTGVAVEDLSALAYAADISGTDIGTLEKGIKGLTKVMDDASRGIGEGLDAFEELDIAVVDTEGNLRSTVDVLKEAAAKISAIENPTKQAAYAMDLFGAKAGPQLLPLLKAGEGGIEDLMAKAKELGITMSTEAATAAAAFTDRMTDLKESLAGAGRDIGMILIPPLTTLAEKAVEIIKNIKDWAEAHKPLVEMIVNLAAKVGVLAAVDGPILIAVSAFMKMKGAVIAVSTAIKVFTATSGPIGWLILAAGALYLAWETNFGGIRDFTLAVVEKVQEALGWLWDKVQWVLEKLGLYHEKIIEVSDAVEETVEPTNNFTTANIELADSLGEVADKAKDATENIIDYADKATEEYVALSIKATDSWADFYAFWEAEARRTAAAVSNTIESVATKVDITLTKIKDAAGEITSVILPGGGIISTGAITSPNVGAGYFSGSDTAKEIYESHDITGYASGTDYVPRTGLAMLHEGEGVLDKSENKAYQSGAGSFSPTIHINNPVVRNDNDISNMRSMIESVLNNYSKQQFKRQGNEILLGV